MKNDITLEELQEKMTKMKDNMSRLQESNFDKEVLDELREESKVSIAELRERISQIKES